MIKIYISQASPWLRLLSKVIIPMKIAFLLVIVTCLNVSAKVFSQEKLSLDIKNVKLEKALQIIEKQSGYRFVYSPTEGPFGKSVSIKTEDTPISTILDQILSGTSLTYALKSDNLITISLKGSVSLDITAKGIVKDSTGLVLPGVSVSVKGVKGIGTSTDADGKFSLKVPDNATLVFSIIGYETIEIPAISSMIVVLKASNKLLDEVVVIGYGTRKKVELTGAVSTISGKQLTESPVANVANAIAGRVPGVVATNPNGRPGSGSNLNVRGFSTIASDNQNSNNRPLVIVDGVQRDDGFGAIDPNDIESISVLKDAAASAVYGARANNGIFLITTKRGVLGKPSVSYTSIFSIQQPTSFPQLLSPGQYARAINEGQKNIGGTPGFTDAEIQKFDTGEDGVNWYDATFRKNSPMTNHNLTITGGTDAIKYFASLGYVNQDGMYDNINYKAYKFRSNVDAKINNTLTLGINLEGRQENNNAAAIDANTIFSHANRVSPAYRAYFASGRPVNTAGEHPTEEAIHSGYNNYNVNTFQGTLSLNQKLNAITPGLEANGRVSFGKIYAFRKVFALPYTMYNEDTNGNITGTKIVGGVPNLNEVFEQTNTVFYNVSLNYQRNFGKHNINALLLFEQNKSTGNNLNATKQDFPTQIKDELFVSGPLNQSVTGTSLINDARRALVGRLGYTFNSKYIVETSFRYDGSYIFPEGKQFGFFPAVSAAWRISEESFIKNNPSLSFIDNLKLRASKGLIGNDRVSAYQFQDAYTIATSGGTIPVFNNLPQPIAYYGVYPNPYITWEKSDNTDIGLEASFWKGLFGFEFDYFIKDTKDILRPRDRSTPATFGRTLPFENYARVKNKGFEIVLNHQNHIGQVNYKISANASYAVNKVTAIDDPAGGLDFQRQLDKPMDFRAGYKSVGIFQSDAEAQAWMSGKEFGLATRAGDIKYADLNGDGMIDSNDQLVLSNYNATPRVMFGLSGDINWKNFDLSFLIQGAAAKNILLAENARVMFDGGPRNSFTYLLDAWSPTNTGAEYPLIWPGGRTINNQPSDIWLKNSAYARLKSVNIGYTFSNINLKKIHLNGIRVFVSGTNLFTVSPLNKIGFDPEAESGAGSYYPQQRVFSAGVNVKF
ncbi:SusC/RagA family TonB-linked outer membrane protein [Pedobacter nototheniae]|uniref:SusC/RagA family TonB-linked outer membrane protein n=1 Tax=Pedobacter nototheniae TaxID=2488994 RepID=UPI002931A1AF|nr:SusC/RagA family TonB-linked outer membrane protein [Pedobacter nototheniae]